MCSSSGNDNDTCCGRSLLKDYLERKKASEKVRWLNTPNAYHKMEILETGTTDPKKVTKVKTEADMVGWMQLFSLWSKNGYECFLYYL